MENPDDTFILMFNIVLAFFFSWIGYMIKYKKKYGWIAGFSDYSTDKEVVCKKYDMKKMGNVVGNSAFLFSGILILFSVLSINPMISYCVAAGVMFLYILIFSGGIKRKTEE